MSSDYYSDVSLHLPPIALPWSHVLLMCVSYVSMILYLWIVILILVNRSKYPAMQSAFFGLLLNQAFADLFMFLVIELLLRPRKFRLLPIFTRQTNSFFAKCCQFALVTTRSAMFLGYFPFALNRFTIFFRPMLHTEIWTPKTAYLCAILQWFFPILLNICAFFVMPSEISFILLGSGHLQFKNDPATAYVSSIQAFVTGVLVSAICAVLYTWSFRYVRKNSLHSYSQNLSDYAAKYETRLLICAFITFLPMLLEAIRNIVQLTSLYAFHAHSVYLTSTEIFYYTTEIASITQPWTILITNKLLRNLLWKPKKKCHTAIVLPFFVQCRP